MEFLLLKEFWLLRIVVRRETLCLLINFFLYNVKFKNLKIAGKTAGPNWILLFREPIHGYVTWTKNLNFFYWSVLFVGGNVNTRKMSRPGMGSIFHIKNQWNILVIGNYNVNHKNIQNSMLLSSSDTRGTLMHLFLFTNCAQRELVSICTQSIYATAINFPCISTLARSNFDYND